MRALVVLSIILLFSAFLIYSTSLGKSASSVIVVPDDFSSIQAAVDAADAGDTVFVKAGMYHENVVVNKSISLVGEDANRTIIDGSAASGNLVSVTANNATVSGFTVKSSVNKNEIGIILTDSNFSNISGNVITECQYGGVVLDSNSSNNLLSGNYITRTREGGIRCLLGARSNTIVNNTVFRCGLAIYMATTANESVIFHNSFITNARQTHCYSSPNTWDDGYPSGGNYWTDYIGSDLYNGPSQDIPGSDGIGDTPYTTIGGAGLGQVEWRPTPNNTDKYPFFVSGHETTVRFYLEPSSLTVRKGQTFNVTVKLDSVPEYPGYVGLQFNITWDSAVLNGVGMNDVVFHSVTPEDEQDNIWTIHNRVAASVASYGRLWQDMPRAYIMGYSPIWGNQSVATITLKAVGEGTCDLKVQTIVVASSHMQPLVDVRGYGAYDVSLLNHSTTGGTVDVKQRNPGDSNGDNRVDILDALVVAHAFGARLGDLNYDAMADENGDGLIDIFDVILVAGSFGKTYP